jgi:hypothetical protein
LRIPADPSKSRQVGGRLSVVCANGQPSSSLWIPACGADGS